MSMLRDVRRRALLATGPTLAALMVFYFLFHIVQGERGVLAWLQLRQQITQAETTLAGVADKRDVLQSRVDLLRSDRLDPDMLEERARVILGFADPKDVIILQPPSGPGVLSTGR